MSRPVLGVVCDTRRMGTEFGQGVIDRYVRAAMRHADAAALLVPALPDLMEAREVAGRLDGVLLTGAPSNVAPARYGDAAEGDGPFDPARDAMTAALIAAMLDARRPVFGICRGFQEVNVAFGGTLRRDTSTSDALLRHHAADGVTFDGQFEHRHEVQLEVGGVLAGAFGTDRLTVNSVHFQGVGRLGEGLSVEARSPDGVVEALSANVNGALVVAVQWHPEWRTDDNPDSQTYFQLLGRALRDQV